MHSQRSSPAPYVDWARQGLCPWTTARRHAIRQIQAGLGFAEAARLMKTDRQWIHKWWHRWETNGRNEKALEDRSSRPHKIHSKREKWLHRILDLWERYPHLGAKKLCELGRIPLSHVTVHSVLKENGKTRKYRQKPRYNRRFCRPFPNYLWQSDTTQIRLGDGTWVYIQSILDDHSRAILASRTTLKHPGEGDSILLFKKAMEVWGPPRQVLTDNGIEYCQVQREEPGPFTRFLHAQGVKHIRGRGSHPQTQGKIERWHGSLKNEWLRVRGPYPDPEALQRDLDRWVEHYNLERPHAALSMRFPLEVYLGGLFLTEEFARAVNEVA